jgi:hypothetical protein
MFLSFHRLDLKVQGIKPASITGWAEIPSTAVVTQPPLVDQ